MIQQVNLYQPILRREKKVFSATTMLQVLAVIAVIMFLLFGVSRWQLASLHDESARLRTQEANLAERVASLSRDLQARPESRELRQAVERAQREVELKERLAQLLRNRPSVQQSGFADAFTGLARQRLQGLWLTGVVLENGADNRRVTISGRTSKAELVPQLVQRLGQEPAFKGLRFRRMKVFQPPEDAGAALAFELTTEPEEEDGK